MRLDVFREGQHLGGYDVGDASEVRLGRGRENHVVLPHPTVSRRHASLSRQGDRFLLTDESSNGTFVGQARVSRVLLDQGAEFSAGPFRIRLAVDFGPDWDRETEVGGTPGHSRYGMVGQSSAMRHLFDVIPRLAVASGTVLVAGETGSGKELVARALHEAGPRASGPFVAINCGSISPDIVESELFGHEKGAFTGAVCAHRGAFEQAHRGTLFLDEVGELALNLQPKLLRVLETGEVRRVGSQANLRVDVRVVAATHRDLRQAAAAGSFRKDLLYRLFVLHLPVPSLRERKEDIPLLARHFLGGRAEMTTAAMDRLLGHGWPGNVRELKNVLERAAIMTEGAAIGPSELIFLEDAALSGGGGAPQEQASDRQPAGLPETLEDLERTFYIRALERSKGSIRDAARSLGIPKSTFYERLKRYGINPRPPGDDET